jgi:hypothetical protein
MDIDRFFFFFFFFFISFPQGDDYYNAYTELTPSYGEQFFGRIVDAIVDLSRTPSNLPTLTSSLGSILVFLSSEDEKSLTIEGMVGLDCISPHSHLLLLLTIILSNIS